MNDRPIVIGGGEGAIIGNEEFYECFRCNTWILPKETYAVYLVEKTGGITNTWWVCPSCKRWLIRYFNRGASIPTSHSKI
jgi:hypothetical protein